MPLGDTAEWQGREADGSANPDYCKYCYGDGAFLFCCTMEEMIESCLPGMLEANPGMTASQARRGMENWFPSLKRWSASAHV